MSPSCEAKFQRLPMEKPKDRQDQCTAQQPENGDRHGSERVRSAIHKNKARAPDGADKEKGEVGHWEGCLM